MFAVLALIMAFIEVGLALLGVLLQSKPLFQAVVVYGSPFHLLMTIFTDFSVFLDKSLFFAFVILFHAVKYFAFFRSQLNDDPAPTRYAGIVLEIAYLGFCAYYTL